jgi:hypothetical protein
MLMRPLVNKKAGCGGTVHTCPPAMWEVQVAGSWFKVRNRKKNETLSEE